MQARDYGQQRRCAMTKPNWPHADTIEAITVRYAYGLRQVQSGHEKIEKIGTHRDEKRGHTADRVKNEHNSGRYIRLLATLT